MSFVYFIRSFATGQIYYGSSSTSPVTRFGFHLVNLRYQHHPNTELQACFDEHGEANLNFSVVIDGLTKKEAKKLEVLLIENTPSAKVFNVRGIKSKHVIPRRLDIDPNDILELRGKMRQYQIAQHFGCSPSYVSQIMRGLSGREYRKYLETRKSASSAHFQ